MANIIDEEYTEGQRDAQVKCQAWKGNADPAMVYTVGRNIAIDRLRKRKRQEKYIRSKAKAIVEQVDPLVRLQILELLAAIDVEVELLTGFPNPVLTIVSRIVDGEVPGVKRKDYLTYDDVAELLELTPREARDIRVAMYEAFDRLHEVYL